MIPLFKNRLLLFLLISLFFFFALFILPVYILNSSIKRPFSCVSHFGKEKLEGISGPVLDYYNKSILHMRYNITGIEFLVTGKPCDHKNSAQLLTVFIFSTSSNKSSVKRNTIRNTWGSDTFSKHINFLFIVGEEKKNFVNRKRLYIESQTYQDLVILDFKESYRNITFKSVSVLKWCSQYCPNSKYLLKIDDDMYIDFSNLLLVLRSITIPKVIMGFVIRGKPTRYERSKWYVSKDLYKYTSYPLYVSGGAYVISTDLLPDLLTAASMLPPLPIEDIYLTGLCGFQARATLLGHCGFDVNQHRPYNSWFFEVFTNGHGYSPSDIQTIWNFKHFLFLKNFNWLKFLSNLIM